MAGDPSSSRRCFDARRLPSAVNPARSGGAASEAVCRVSNVARSAGLLPSSRRPRITRQSTSDGTPTSTPATATPMISSMGAESAHRDLEDGLAGVLLAHGVGGDAVGSALPAVEEPDRGGAGVLGVEDETAGARAAGRVGLLVLFADVGGHLGVGDLDQLSGVI